MTSYNLDGFQVYEYSSQSPQTVLFFAHANGIPALSYAHVWKTLVNSHNIRVISYDIRGYGLTRALPIYNNRTWGWKTLVQDHVKLFKRIKSTHPKNTKFILGGHSLGAWLSLFSTEFLGPYPLLLCDPPLLNLSSAIPWYFMHLFHLRHKNPKSQKVLKRKTHFDTFEHAFESFRKTPFLSQWNDESLKGYVEGSFVHDSNTGRLTIRHDLQWEAHLFEQYPPTATQALMTLSKKLRNTLKPVFLVGEKSDACNLRAKNWVNFLLPGSEWVVLPNSGHMFPIEKPATFIDALKEIEERSTHSKICSQVVLKAS